MLFLLYHKVWKKVFWCNILLFDPPYKAFKKKGNMGITYIFTKEKYHDFPELPTPFICSHSNLLYVFKKCYHFIVFARLFICFY